jgi:uncharacterized protein (DUF362 family)
MVEKTQNAAVGVCSAAPYVPPAAQLDRRALLIGGGAALAGLCAAWAYRSFAQPRAAAFLAGSQRYDGPLEQTIRDGLLAAGLEPLSLRGKRVLLKPNLVEPTRASPQMTTHPAMVVATAEVFRRWDATVTVGEGPGHVRDTEMALIESGLDEALRDAGLKFVDLNYDEVGKVANVGRASKLKEFYLPRSVLEAHLVVSLPKLKTHHWVGVTASMKNLYGTLPGIKYGWPKNVLHHAGIPQTVVDINASLPATLAVIDGIVCMEGDGPILGTAKPLGLIAVGMNLPALDATCARIMGINPERVSYLRLSADRLGPTAESRIEQHGEDWRKLLSPFEILDAPHLRGLRAVGELAI